MALRGAAWLAAAALAAAEPMVPDPALRRAAWPFDAPPAASLRGHGPAVYAHYLPVFPRSIDNRPPASDYYAVHYLRPDGEDGKFAAVGGWLRDRPLPRDPLPGRWTLTDLEWEVRAAAELGIDGFIVDLLSDVGVHADRAAGLLRVAARVPGFRIVLMPDMEAGFADRPEALELMIARLAAEPTAARLPDGRLLLAPYNAQRRDPAWWKARLESLAEAGIPCAFLPCVQDLGKYRDGFLRMPAAVGIGEWGSRTLEAVVGQPDQAAPVHAAGRWWMAPVSPQDYRPKNRWVQEAQGTALFRAMWSSARQVRADLVQIATWNDYSEHSHIAPSVVSGWGFYDLTAYETAWYKTGTPPPITRDGITLVHRPMAADAGPKDRQARPTPGLPTVDIVEALVWLPAPAVVRLVGGDGFEVRADLAAGVHRLTVPLTPGTPWAVIQRQGVEVLRCTSTTEVVSTAAEQDLLYRTTTAVAL